MVLLQGGIQRKREIEEEEFQLGPLPFNPFEVIPQNDFPSQPPVPDIITAPPNRVSTVSDPFSPPKRKPTPDEQIILRDRTSVPIDPEPGANRNDMLLFLLLAGAVIALTALNKGGDSGGKKKPGRPKKGATSGG